MTQKNIFKLLSMAFFGIILGLTLNVVPVLAERMHVPTSVTAPLTVSPPKVTMAEVLSFSRNWSGYNATSGTYTGVGATWIVPKSTGSGISADATWVGIGGVTTRDLIQAGTQTIITNGQTNYLAWYELLPGTSHQLPLTVNPGDSVTVSISRQTGNTWNISFHDNTSGQNYQTTVTYNSSLSSAEWIEEAPSSGRSIIPLDNFGSIQFSNAWTIKNGVTINPSQAGAQPINMANSYNQVLAQSSVLGNDGASFAVNRTASTMQVFAVAPSSRGSWRRVGANNIRGFQSSYGYGHYNGRYSE